MPLNARKIAHIRNQIARTHAGRSQQVMLTLRTDTGGTTTLVVNAVWRVMIDSDPTLEGAQNTRFKIGADDDINAMFDMKDITLHQLRSCIYAQLGSDATGAQPAQRYVLLDVEPVGLMPGGDRFFTKWTRQR
jgi:hypothetical protein